MEFLEITIVILFVIIVALMLLFAVTYYELQQFKNTKVLSDPKTRKKKKPPSNELPPELKELYRVMHNVENYKGSDEGMIKAVKNE